MKRLFKKRKRWSSIFYRKAKREEPDKHLAGKKRLAEIIQRQVDRVQFEVEWPRSDDPKYPYKSDLLCSKGSYRFIIEVDGDSHISKDRRWKDAIRDCWFKAYYNITTVRFSADEASSRWELDDKEVLQKIDKGLGSDFFEPGHGTSFCWLKYRHSYSKVAK